MEQKDTSRPVSLRDLWRIFTERWKIMLVAAIVCVCVVYIVSVFAVDPIYQSKASLYVLSKEDIYTGSTNSAFSQALVVVDDCMEILKDYSVLEEVKTNLDLNIPCEELEENILITNPTDNKSRIIYVTAYASTPQEAQAIANEICKVGVVKITNVMGSNQVNIMSRARIDTEPSNSFGISVGLLIGFVAAMLVYAVFFLKFLVDDKIKSDEDIEYYLELSVLGKIPYISEKDGKRTSKAYRHDRR